MSVEERGSRDEGSGGRDQVSGSAEVRQRTDQPRAETDPSEALWRIRVSGLRAWVSGFSVQVSARIRSF
jgi:hypothetical protein